MKHMPFHEAESLDAAIALALVHSDAERRSLERRLATLPALRR
jgi:hypothetical protein